MKSGKFKKTKYNNIPEWALCALEFGMYDNLTEDEIAMVKDFQSQFKHGYVMEVDWDTRGFSSYPDFGKPCDTYEVTFYEPNN